MNKTEAFIKDKNSQFILDNSKEGFRLSRSQKLNILANTVITAGIISFIFLLLILSYQQILLFLTQSLHINIKTYLNQNYHLAYLLYNNSGQILAGLYFLTLVIGVTWSVIRNRNSVILDYIRRYISLMAKGNYHLRIPEDNIDQYQTLAQDVNILMDSINSAFEDRKNIEKTKDELMNNIGHDIRTPLTSIIGYLRLIKDSPDISEEELQQHLDLVYSKAKAMQVLVNDLFEYTSSQQTTAKMNFMDIDMKSFIEQIAAEFSLQAKQKGIEIITEVTPPDLHSRMDPDKMARVLSNFIINGIKYGTGADWIKIIVKQMTISEYQEYSLHPEAIKFKSNQQLNHWLIIEVRNNGQLVKEEELDKIYERSYRADQSRTTKEPGSGLGLSIVRNFVNLHKGITYALIDHNVMVFRVEIPDFQYCD